MDSPGPAQVTRGDPGPGVPPSSLTNLGSPEQTLITSGRFGSHQIVTFRFVLLKPDTSPPQERSWRHSIAYASSSYQPIAPFGLTRSVPLERWLAVTPRPDGRYRQPRFGCSSGPDPRPWTASDSLLADLPTASRVVLKGAGHAPWAERPADTRNLVINALQPAFTR
jgi:hypothetical protein